MNEQEQPDSGIHDTPAQSTCVPSFNLLGLTVPENSVTKIFIWKVTEWQYGRMMDGQGKSSIAPTFSIKRRGKLWAVYKWARAWQYL